MLHNGALCDDIIYRITGIFRGRKVSRIGGKNRISQRKLL